MRMTTRVVVVAVVAVAGVACTRAPMPDPCVDALAGAGDALAAAIVAAPDPVPKVTINQSLSDYAGVREVCGTDVGNG